MKSATGPLRSAGPLSEVQCQSGVQQFGFRSAALLLEALKPDSLNDTKLFQQSPLLMNATYLCRGQSQPRSTKGRLPDEKIRIEVSGPPLGRVSAASVAVGRLPSQHSL